ncbi:hypothetical protein E4K73_24400 [Streptomyces sp. IB201691-2A2]|nr:hypothetical protein E4K73_24400 [Streptomyces sp. IB201691-2A2]
MRPTPGAHRAEHAEAERRRIIGTPLLRYSRYTVHRCPLPKRHDNQASLPCSWRMRQPWETPITGRRAEWRKPSQGPHPLPATP